MGLALGYRHALNVQIFIKMHRSDYAEKQLKIMQQIDEDHTLTQLANTWLGIAVVSNFTVQCYDMLKFHLCIGPETCALTSSLMVAGWL
jgi:coatomer protein complex subunit epsilon